MAEHKHLPPERESITHKFHCGGMKVYVTASVYPDTGDLAEVFLTLDKEGSLVRGLFRCLALVISIALQYGVPLERITSKLKGVRFEPNGFTGNPDIPYARSIVDYLAQFLENKFLKQKGEPK